VSWYDTITYVFKYLPSFVSKDTVKDYPVFGWITTNLKSIFVERENANNRK
jgi:lysophosphatidylcholine acyltransferase/lyso-PAF acetyltransferase